MAHAEGLNSIDTEVMLRDANTHKYEVKATVTGDRGSYSGHGEAEPSSVKRGFSGALLRMAETRAIVRALRWYCGIGITALDELGPEPGQEAAPPPTRKSTPIDNGPARTTGENQIKNARGVGELDPCPWCGGRVWDNRDPRANGENTQPAVSCMNREECLGGVKNQKVNGEWQIVAIGPWKQWEYDQSKWRPDRGSPPKGTPKSEVNAWMDKQNGKIPAAAPSPEPPPEPAGEAAPAPDWDQQDIPF